MKKFLFIVLFSVLTFSAAAQEMLVGSYNIRYKNRNDSLNGNVWTKRCQVICDQINFMDPMIFGTQEVLYGQLQDLLKGLDGYDYIGIGRDDGEKGGEHEAIFYKKTDLNFWTMATSGSARRPKNPVSAGMPPASASALGASSRSMQRIKKTAPCFITSTSTWTTSEWWRVVRRPS